MKVTYSLPFPHRCDCGEVICSSTDYGVGNSEEDLVLGEGELQVQSLDKPPSLCLEFGCAFSSHGLGFVEKLLDQILPC